MLYVNSYKSWRSLSNLTETFSGLGWGLRSACPGILILPSHSQASHWALWSEALPVFLVPSSLSFIAISHTANPLCLLCRGPELTSGVLRHLTIQQDDGDRKMLTHNLAKKKKKKHPKWRVGHRYSLTHGGSPTGKDFIVVSWENVLVNGSTNEGAMCPAFDKKCGERGAMPTRAVELTRCS